MVAALAARAHAGDDTPSLRIGGASDATVSSLKLAIDGRTAVLSLTLTTREREAHEIVLGMDMPHGGAVTGMAMIQGSERTDAAFQPPAPARDEYIKIVEHVVDPALLESVGGDRSHDHLRLRVFPVAKVAPVTIELVLELPAGDALELDPLEQDLPRVEVTAGATHAVWRHLRTPRRIALPEGEAHGYDPLQLRVDAHRSLYAEPQPAAPATTLAGGPPGLRSARQVRDVIRANAASLAACGDVESHAIEFMIAKDGRVSSVSAGDACLEEAIRGWKFPPASEATRVAYPLSWYVASGS